MPLEPEDVERHQGDRDLGGHPLDLALALEVHPLLQRLERVLAVGLERDDLGVEHGVHLVDELVDHPELGVLV
jgi:hypothetical protein